jgi:DNA-binding GntR family transcriptional regulator
MPPRRKNTLRDSVYESVKAMIVTGQLPPGARMTEADLAGKLKVSRTPVREALNQLQTLGLVTVKPQRGSYVFEPGEADIEALCEFRCVLEPSAARLAWQHDREATLEALEAAVADMAAARKHKDAVRYSRADTRLHEAFVQHCGNPYVQAAYATAGARIAALRTHLSASADVLHPRGIEQHKQLLQLFRAGDFAAFDALMREHVLGTRASYVAKLKARTQPAL